MNVDVVVADIGGTHARFALAEVDSGRVVALESPVTFKTADHPTLESAWAAFSLHVGRTLPPRASIAVACPVDGDLLKLTNNPWVIRPAQLRAHLGLTHFSLLNDFGSISHAVVNLGQEHFRHVYGPQQPLPAKGVIGIVGPGTGLGVAHVVRQNDQSYIVESEGGHIGFAPQDAIEDAILSYLRRTFPRVSAERLVSGPGLANIYSALAVIKGLPVLSCDEKALWSSALEGTDQLAVAALERFCQCLGAVSGDLALAQGASAVVIAGGLGRRLADVLADSGFGARFISKGRLEPMMAGVPVKVITYPEPGLYGAAAAYARAYR